MKGREAEPSHLATPPDHVVEWAVRTWAGDTRFVRARTAYAAVAALGLAFSEARWVKPLLEDF